jgi:hypothetical protein
MTEVSAKLIADVGRRERQRPVKKPDIGRFQLAQLRRLLRHRNHVPLPDDERSRRYLQAMLDLARISHTIFA